MKICKFFLQGNCRFGSKCNYDHLDLKQLIKSDVESAINGKQWPISCYGPFKDKKCLPNFIEDQSFEEIRFLCYDAKQKNYFERFHQQFTKEVQDVTNKMKSLVPVTSDVLNVLIQIHDSPEQQLSDSAIRQNSNVFKQNSGNIQASNIFGNGNATFGGAEAANIFGNSTFGATAQQPSIFGGQTANTGLMAFSQQQQPQQQQTNMGVNIFAAASQNALNVQGQPQQELGIFARASQEMFGPRNVQAQPQQELGIFAKAQQQPTAFGQSTGNFAQAMLPNSGNIFTQSMTPSQNNGNLFGAPQPNMFAQALQMEQTQPQPQPQPSAFFQPTAQSQQLTPCTTYSKLEDLSAEEIESFQADCFVLGKIPCSPPPKELIR